MTFFLVLIIGFLFGIIIMSFYSKYIATQLKVRGDRNAYLLKISSKLNKRYLNTEYIADKYKSSYGNKVIIYGMGELGKIIIEDFEKGKVDIIGTLDRNPYKKYKDYKNYTMSECPENITVLVTAVYDYNDIKKELRTYKFDSIISLEELINE